MKKIEELAVELALLSNGDVQQLATVLVRDYAPRADAIETALGNSFYDRGYQQLEKIND